MLLWLSLQFLFPLPRLFLLNSTLDSPSVRQANWSVLMVKVLQDLYWHLKKTERRATTTRSITQPAPKAKCLKYQTQIKSGKLDGEITQLPDTEDKERDEDEVRKKNLIILPSLMAITTLLSLKLLSSIQLLQMWYQDYCCCFYLFFLLLLHFSLFSFYSYLNHKYNHN